MKFGIEVSKKKKRFAFEGEFHESRVILSGLFNNADNLSMKHWWSDTDRENLCRLLGGTTLVPLLLDPQQIPHEIAWTLNRVLEVNRAGPRHVGASGRVIFSTPSIRYSLNFFDLTQGWRSF